MALAIALTAVACSGSANNPIEQGAVENPGENSELNPAPNTIPENGPGAELESEIDHSPADWSEFEGGVSPFHDPDNPESRTAAGFMGGARTLKGAVNTNANWADSPFSRYLNASADDIMLLKVKNSAFPSASQTSRARFTGSAGHQGYLNVSSDNTWVSVPLLMDEDQTFELRMFNSTVDWGAIHDEATVWHYWMVNLPKDDVAEPNDNENPNNVGDRTMGEPVPVGRQVSRSMYDDIQSSDQDREDWYVMDFDGSSTYRFIFGTTGPTWGWWRYDVRVYDSSGTLVDSLEDFAGLTAGFNVSIGAAGTYYVQVEGEPLSGRGGSVYFGQYALRSYKTAGCGGTAPNLIGFEPGSDLKAFDDVQMGVNNTGGAVTTWDWDFGGGAVPNTSSASDPTVELQEPGTYSASVTATNSCGSDTYNFDLVVVPKLVGLEVKVFRGAGGQNPGLWWNLDSWNESDVRDWFDEYINPVFEGTGWQLDPARIDVNYVTDKPHLMVLDSSAEFNEAKAELVKNDRTMHLGVIDDQTYSGWAGIAFTSYCGQTNNTRGMFVLQLTSFFAVTATAHEMGHVLGLPHIRTNTNPMTPLNYNLMSYGSTNTDLSHNIDREDGSGCWLSNDNPMNQYAITYDYVTAMLDTF